MDADALCAHWGDASTNVTPAFTISLPVTALAVMPSSSKSIDITVAVAGGFSSSLALSVAGAPPGVQTTFAPSALV